MHNIHNYIVILYLQATWSAPWLYFLWFLTMLTLAQVFSQTSHVNFSRLNSMPCVEYHWVSQSNIQHFGSILNIYQACSFVSMSAMLICESKGHIGLWNSSLINILINICFSHSGCHLYNSMHCCLVQRCF